MYTFLGVQRKFIRTFSYTVYFSFGWVGENKEEASKASWFEEIVCEAKNLVFFRLTFVYVHELLFRNDIWRRIACNENRSHN